ncbi:hypothetical protein [Nannocystis pusilla]|uniref:hypothetical protein n=1 Tax=Nannocystis pusilla TaxID=889268 RepID=UPI003B7B60F0
MSEQPHRLAVVVVAVWLAAQAIALVRGLLPLPPPLGPTCRGGCSATRRRSSAR